MSNFDDRQKWEMIKMVRNLEIDCGLYPGKDLEDETRADMAKYMMELREKVKTLTEDVIERNNMGCELWLRNLLKEAK